MHQQPSIESNLPTQDKINALADWLEQKSEQEVRPFDARIPTWLPAAFISLILATLVYEVSINGGEAIKILDSGAVLGQVNHLPDSIKEFIRTPKGQELIASINAKGGGNSFAADLASYEQMYNKVEILQWFTTCFSILATSIMILDKDYSPNLKWSTHLGPALARILRKFDKQADIDNEEA